jgi:hypothetical protein
VAVLTNYCCRPLRSRSGCSPGTVWRGALTGFVQPAGEAFQGRDALLHFADRHVHGTTTVMFNRNVAIEFVNLLRQSAQDRLALAVGQLRTDATRSAAQPFDTAHRVVNGAELLFQLCQEI